MTEQEKRERLAAVKSWLKTLREEESDLARELGESVTGDQRSGQHPQRDTLSAKAQAERQDAELFDQLSPGELTQLYLNDRERWQKIIEAKERAGLRRLFQG